VITNEFPINLNSQVLFFSQHHTLGVLIIVLISFFDFFQLQAILFYIPRWLWKNWEAGKIQALMMDLDLGIISEAEKRSKKKLLLDYLYSNLKNHNFWAYRYFFCELLSLINVVGKSKSPLTSFKKNTLIIITTLKNTTTHFFANHKSQKKLETFGDLCMPYQYINISCTYNYNNNNNKKVAYETMHLKKLLFDTSL
jgi:hypothetical protein